jgi:hypothetical protein
MLRVMLLGLCPQGIFKCLVFSSRCPIEKNCLSNRHVLLYHRILGLFSFSRRMSTRSDEHSAYLNLSVFFLSQSAFFLYPACSLVAQRIIPREASEGYQWERQHNGMESSGRNSCFVFIYSILSMCISVARPQHFS